MSIYKKDKKFISYLVVLLGLFVLVIFTKNEIGYMQENLDQKETAEIQLETDKKELSDLNKIESDLKKDDSATKRYDITMSEDKLMNYFYSYLETISAEVGTISIKSLALSEGKKNEFGFLESTVTLSMNVSNDKVMKQFLDFAVSENAEYQFFIDTFYYPTDDREGGFNINLPLKLYYK